jgi:hypothetical protein
MIKKWWFKMMSDAQINYAAAKAAYHLKKGEASHIHDKYDDELSRAARKGTDDDILEVFLKIETENKKIGLYEASKNLFAAEDQLINWGRDIIHDIKTKSVAGAVSDEVLDLFDDPKISALARSIFRDKLVSCLMRIDFNY